MPRERKQRGHRHAEKRKLEREEEEAVYIASQERNTLFYDRPKNPFGLLTREEEKYFFEVYDEFKKDTWDDEDAKEAFVHNVLAEMKGKELKVATSQVGRFFEMLLAQSPRAEVQRIMGIFAGHAVELAKHRFGSFALEKVAGHAGIWASREIEGNVEDEQPGEPGEPLKPVGDMFLDMVEELIYSEMHELFIDPFASHVYQAIIQTLNGHPEKNLGGEGNVTKKRKKKHTADTIYQIPETFQEALARLLKTVKKWDLTLLQSLVFDKYAVPLMQLLIECDTPKKSKKKSKDKSASKKSSSKEALANIILFGSDPDSEEQQAFIDRLLRDQVGSRILETIVRTVSDDTIRSLFTKYFKENLFDLALDPAANFVVQRILERLTEPEDVSFCLHNLINLNIDNLVKFSRISIIVALLDACARTNNECDEALDTILQAISLLPNSNNNLWATLMNLDQHTTPKESLLKPKNPNNAAEEIPSSYPVSRFGALLAASILRLPVTNPTYTLHESLSQLETSEVLFYLTHPQTSHVIEQMLQSHYPVPQRRKLLNHILGSSVKLACDPAGSHIIDACWAATQNIKHYREKMAKEMAEEGDIVRTNYFGRQVWRNWNMDGFVGERFDWGRQPGEEGEGERRGFAKMPVVKKKPWQKFAEKKVMGSGDMQGKGIVTKHFSAVKNS